MTSPGHHQALIIAEKGAPHSLVTRATPQPGLGQILVQVKAIALNPVDAFQRDLNAMITQYPTVLGSDISGIVASIGPDVDSLMFTPGSTRVCAYASAYFHQSNADYGAFQELVLVDANKATPLPDSVSFDDAAVLPMSVSVALSGFLVIGIDFRDTVKNGNNVGHNRNKEFQEEEEEQEGTKKAVLVWGASTSVGSGAVQAAKLMGFRVYATASPEHHTYVQETLKADRVFDYKSADVVSHIVDAVKRDGVSMYNCFLGRGDLATISRILLAVRSDSSDDDDNKPTPKIASAPIVPADVQSLVGEEVEVAFVLTPTEPKQSHDYFHAAFNLWLKEKLATGEYVPSPRVKVVGKGLVDVDKGLDELKKGVSRTKLVVEL